jgi:hypothetical protein
MAMIRAAAAAENVDVTEPRAKVAILPAKFKWIAGVEIGRSIKFSMTPPRSIRAKTA